LQKRISFLFNCVFYRVQIRKWADEYRSQNSDIDYVALRKQKENEKVKRHYDKNIAANKVSFYCEYCKEDHETLKINYDRNITKNGRFICIKENGAITGKKSSNKKENPYASEGKKQCTKCNEIKLFEEFGFDKSRSDGYANRCKGCRSKGVKKCI
jgi:bisphosphoglycerate-dependent phosphoglycerate mutase